MMSGEAAEMGKERADEAAEARVTPVAPGLEMERQHLMLPDGRYLLYYRFREENGRDEDNRPPRT